MKPRDVARATVFRATRALLALRRASPGANARRIREQGESPESVVIRPAVASDVPALAELHVRTWNDAYAPLMTGPPVRVREAQWNEAFARADHRWFAFVAQRTSGALAGFVKCVMPSEPGGRGALDKLYVAREWQGLGLGRRLVAPCARHFLDHGVTRMAAFVDPRNPSCGFFEHIGGHWLVEDGGTNFSWYVWEDIAALARDHPAR